MMRARKSGIPLALVVLVACLTLGTGTAWATGYAAPNLQVVNVADGDQFWNYDYDAKYADASARGHNDWPVTIIFTGNASVSKVRSALSTWLGSIGSTFYGYIHDAPNAWEWRSDAGRKQSVYYFSGSKLLARPEVVHVRLYAHNGDRSSNTAWGNYVLCTTHYDYNELGQVRGAASWSGDSERAAAQIVNWLLTKGYVIQANAFDCRNGFTWGPTYPALHHWQSDGRATLIRIP
jgi:hypothetical protein